MITALTKSKLPHFFRYAKDKESDQTEERNTSFVNKLDYLIKNPRISFMYLEDDKKQKLGKPDYKLLMYNPNTEVPIVKNKSGKLLEGTHPVVLKYVECSYSCKFERMFEERKKSLPRDVLYKSKPSQELIYEESMETIKEQLRSTGYTDIEIADVLVKYLYDIKDSKNKNILWICYGDLIYENLTRKVKYMSKEIQCVDCGKWFEIYKYNSATCRCKSCSTERKRIQARLTKQRYRAKIKNI